MSDELAPCPFCGGSAFGQSGGLEEVSNGDRVWFPPKYGCDDCGIYAENAETWNRRTYPPQTQAVITELVSLLTDPSVGPLTPGVKHCMVDVDREAFLAERGIR